MGPPRLLVPELGIFAAARPEDVLGQPGVLAKRRRDEDATRIVHLALDGPGYVDSLELLHGPVKLRELAEPLFEGGPLGHRVGDEARVEGACEHDPSLAARFEDVAIPSGEARSAFGVDGVLVPTAKHRSTLALGTRCADRTSGLPEWASLPVLGTIRHFFPPSFCKVWVTWVHVKHFHMIERAPTSESDVARGWDTTLPTKPDRRPASRARTRVRG